MTTWTTDLIFLGEHQYGFSPDRIGFPSISACRAVGYLTARGIFGFHQASGAQPSKHKGFAEKFARFVNGLAPGQGLGLYVAAKVGLGGSYLNAGEHAQEMQAFATELNFNGPIYSFDLTNKWEKPGVYIEMVNKGNTLELFGNTWQEHLEPEYKGRVDPSKRQFHKFSGPYDDDFVDPGDVLIKVETTGQIPLPVMRIA